MLTAPCRHSGEQCVFTMHASVAWLVITVCSNVKIHVLTYKNQPLMFFHQFLGFRFSFHCFHLIETKTMIPMTAAILMHTKTIRIIIIGDSFRLVL